MRARSLGWLCRAWLVEAVDGCSGCLRCVKKAKEGLVYEGGQALEAE